MKAPWTLRGTARCGMLIAVLGALPLHAQDIPAKNTSQDTSLCRPERTGSATPSDVLNRLAMGDTLFEPQFDQVTDGATDETADQISKADERGLGGTGIVGVVTGFASICVNGYEIKIGAGTAITVEGATATEADIRLGQVVVVEAYPANGSLQATRIDIQLAVIGPISETSNDGATLKVSGQTVEIPIDDETRESLLKVGDWVAVSGLRRRDDVIANAAVVKLETPGQRIFISGIVRAEADAQMRIGDLLIQADAAADDIAKPGQYASMVGIATNGVLSVQSARVERMAPFSHDVRHVSILTYDARPNSLGALSGRPTLRLPEKIELPTAGAASPVQIDGRLSPGGMIAPERITAPPPRPPGRPTKIDPQEKPQTKPDASLERQQGAHEGERTRITRDRTQPRANEDRARPQRVNRPFFRRLDRPIERPAQNGE